jgi:hypothetical protein
MTFVQAQALAMIDSGMEKGIVEYLTSWIKFSPANSIPSCRQAAVHKLAAHGFNCLPMHTSFLFELINCVPKV